MKINLIVIKTHQIHELAQFYSLLGLIFEYHQHGKGVFHYSTVLNDIVFEIYPTPKNTATDNTTRLGFKVENLDILIKELPDKGVKIHNLPTQTEYGYWAVIEDLDGRKIELTEE
jgi:lactoylglutathione lyase